MFLNILCNYYRFKLKWLKDEYKSLATIENIDQADYLDPTEKKYLKGLHKRDQAGQLPRKPSKEDYKALKKAYGEKCMWCMYSFNSV